MTEINVLRHCWLMLRARLVALHDDQRGITTLEAVLWIGGLAVLAIASVAMITGKVNQATNNIPTGP
ncbi:MAG: hypothetical protein KY450_13695 [Actinobacteria bacterium]|nr:hypothetical protein [Actinomycetota bacterium]